MALTWDALPTNGTSIFFSRENYEKYSLAPTISELWLLLNRQGTKSAKLTSASDSAAVVVPETKPVSESIRLPEPRVPYSRFSRLTEREQKTFLMLMRKYSKKQLKKTRITPEIKQYVELKAAVNKEVEEFMKFLQNAAKLCVEDYKKITDDAVHYTEAFLSACMERVKNYPKLYTLHEVTSIMGGKVNPELTLKLEKNLLALGAVRLIRVQLPPLPAPLELIADYKNLLTLYPPEKKASELQTDISSDPNAEKLSVKYCPHVALTSQALFTLLNNHGPKYSEPWEIPVHVKIVPTKGNKLRKMIYIDSPFLKKEMTIREKNQIFHEAPFDFILTQRKSIAVPISAVQLDKSLVVTDETNVFCESSHSKKNDKTVSVDIDFENDLVDLETFGEISCSSKKPKSTSLKASKGESPQLPPGKVSNSNPEKTGPADPKCPIKSLSKMLQKEKQLTSTSEVHFKRVVGQKEKRECSEGSVSGPKKIKLTTRADISWSESDDTSSFRGFESDEIDELVGSRASDRLVVETKESSVGDQNVTDANDSRSTTAGCDDMNQTLGTISTISHSDSDEERLIIDVKSLGSSNSVNDAHISEITCNTVALPPCTDPTPNTLTSPPCIQSPSDSMELTPADSLQNKKVTRRPRRKLSKEFDPVGQILKMQCQLLNPSRKKPAEQHHSSGTSSGAMDSAQSSLQPSVQSLASSVSEVSDSTIRTKSTGLKKPAQTSEPADSQKGLLSSELQSCVEDESEYVTPKEGNLVYKLFSLDDLLLLVRSSVHKVQTRHRTSHKKKKRSPVYALPKLEYQACYGVEALTESEICHLWTETHVNSSTSFYVGHIDAFTSNLFVLEQGSAEEITEKFGAFKLASSLNILHHLIKTVTNLQEGSYLLSHAAGNSSVTIYKSSRGVKAARAAYNLHEAHSSLPPVPSTLSVPWVPLDPSITLPYHIHHGRIPCTFPPRSSDSSLKPRVGVSKTKKCMPNLGNVVSMETPCNPLPAQSSGSEGVAPAKKKKNKGKRAKRLKIWKAKKRAKGTAAGSKK